MHIADKYLGGDQPLPELPVNAQAAAPVSRLVQALLADTTVFAELPELTAALRHMLPVLRAARADAGAAMIVREQPAVGQELARLAARLSTAAVGAVHFAAFDSEVLGTAGLSSYLASCGDGDKILLLAAAPRYRAVFAGLDYEICVLTTEMGHGISGYGGIGTYVQTLLPYLAESMRVVEVGWDNGGRSLAGQEIGLAELRRDGSSGDTLRFFGIAKEPATGYDSVLQARRLAIAMAGYVARYHARALLVYTQAWYNGAAVPALRAAMPYAAPVAIFHSVQPGKHWKALELGGALGQWYAVQFESRYTGVDGIIAMSPANAAEIVRYYGQGAVSIDRDYFDWLLGAAASAALLAAMAARGYIRRRDERRWRICPALEPVLAANARWWQDFIAWLESFGAAADTMIAPALLTDTARWQEYRDAFCRRCPAPRLELPPEFAARQQDILLLLTYPRAARLGEKIAIIPHGISGEAADIPALSKKQAMPALYRLLVEHGKYSPAAAAARRELLDQAAAGRRKIVTYIGRLSGQKGLAILIDSLAYLDPAEYVLVLIAGNPDSPAMQQLAEQTIAAHPAIIWIAEHLKDAALLSAARCASDVIVVPSTNEPFGLVLPEAFRAGVPVVALSGSGGPDFIVRDLRRLGVEQGNGTLADAQTPAALAAALRRIFSLPDRQAAALRRAAFADFQQRFQLRTGAAVATARFFEARIFARQSALFDQTRRALAALMPVGETRQIAILSEEFRQAFGAFIQAVLLCAGYSHSTITAGRTSGKERADE